MYSERNPCNSNHLKRTLLTIDLCFRDELLVGRTRAVGVLN